MGNTKTGKSDVRGGAAKGKRDDVLRAFSGSTSAAEEAGWDEASPETIARLVVAVVAYGGLCSFGRSRDGGALSVTVLLDGDKRTRWIRPEENPDTVLEKLVEPFEILAE